MKKTRHTLQFNEERGHYFARIWVEGARRYYAFTANERESKTQLATLETDLTSATRMADMRADGLTAYQNDPRNLQLLALANSYMGWVQANRSAGTYKLRRSYLQQFLKWIGPEVTVADVTRKRLEDFYAWARSIRGRTANGGNEHLAAVKAMLRWAEEMEICACPVRRFPKMMRVPPETRRLQQQEIQAALLALPHDLRDLILFGMLTGLRPKEIRELNRAQLIYNGGLPTEVRIERHKTSGTARDPRPRSVPLSVDAASIVVSQLAAHPKSDFVFLNADGQPYGERVLRRKMDRACKRAGIRSFSPYSLRHTFASLQAEQGMNQIVLTMLMGHTTPRTTQRYVSASTDYNRSAMEQHAAKLKYLMEPVDEPSATEPANKRPTEEKKDLRVSA